MAPQTAHVDVTAVTGAAEQFDASARELDAAVRTHLTRLQFSGASAGRAHTARGEALSAALAQIVQAMNHWSRASAEIAAALHATAMRYRDADTRAAAGHG